MNAIMTIGAIVGALLGLIFGPDYWKSKMDEQERKLEESDGNSMLPIICAISGAYAGIVAGAVLYVVVAVA